MAPSALTIGKMRRLQQLANHKGIYVMTAMDQRGSMRRMLNPGAPQSVSVDDLTQIKLELAATFSPLSSAILLDPQFGAAQSVAHAMLDRSCGLLVALESQDYDQDGDIRRSRIPDNWSVEKIARMGATAVKLLAYYHPDQPETAEWQERLIADVHAACQSNDIPFVLEIVVYPLGGLSGDSAEFAAQKPGLVVRSAARLSGYCDLYKAEFPANVVYDTDPQRLAGYCQELNAACAVPWVVLSAGVDIEIFQTMVRIACQNGASGFLAGRAIWKKATRIADVGERRAWLESEGVANLRSLVDVANESATPWPAKAAAAGLLPDVASVDAQWFANY